MAHKEEKEQVIDFQEHMDKKLLKISTLKISTRLNMQKLREEYNEALILPRKMVQQKLLKNLTS